MFGWNANHQASKSFWRFLAKFPGLLRSPGTIDVGPPTVPFTVRVGATGHLKLKADGGVGDAVSEALAGLREYADHAAVSFNQMMFGAQRVTKRAELRLVSQLAAGADQLAAERARAQGYRLHTVLPGERAAFEIDVERYGHAAALDRFRDLLENSDRVLELDRDHEREANAEFTNHDYAQAGSIILLHSDIVLVIVSETAPTVYGGSRWLEEKTMEADLPVVRIPIEHPWEGVLSWTEEDGRRQECHIFDPVTHKASAETFKLALDRQLLRPVVDPEAVSLGRWETCSVQQLDVAQNDAEWNGRWGPSDPMLSAWPSVASVKADLDADFKRVKVWADHRASGMADLARGSHGFVALVSVLATLSVLFAHSFEAFHFCGEAIEVGLLIALFLLVRRSDRFRWRLQWLSLRQLERVTDQAAWLALLGRGKTFSVFEGLAVDPSDGVAAWTNAYFRTLIRAASFPTARLDEDYRKAAQLLVLNRLLVDQISYCEGDAEFHKRSDEILERGVRLCVGGAFAISLILLIAPFVSHLDVYLAFAANRSNHDWLGPVSNIAGLVAFILAALLPGVSSALASLRHGGEYNQIAMRNIDLVARLKPIERYLEVRRPNQEAGFRLRALRSRVLAAKIEEATDALADEVAEWRRILRHKNIEMM